MSGSIWGITPRASIEMASARWGRDVVVTGCVDLLQGRPVELELVEALGGPPARRIALEAPSVSSYWLRVWGARGLLWAWDRSAAPTLLAALEDESWRVREMAAKVAARHLVGEAIPAVELLQEDPVPRVRVAAERALVLLTTARA